MQIHDAVSGVPKKSSSHILVAIELYLSRFSSSAEQFVTPIFRNQSLLRGTVTYTM